MLKLLGFVSELAKRELLVERMHYPPDVQDHYVGAYIRPKGLDAAASIEAWVGAGGWDLDIGKIQFLAEDRGEMSVDRWTENVFQLVSANILGGCATYRIGWATYFICGDHLKRAQEIASKRRRKPKLVTEWASWRIVLESDSPADPIPTFEKRIG